MSSKKSFMKYFALGAAVFGILAIIMMFCPAIAVKDSDTTYSFFQTMFGYTNKETILGHEVSTKVLEFSFMNLLTLILVAAGTVLSLMKMVNPKSGKLFSIIAAVCFVVAGILFFCVISFTQLNAELGASAVEKLKESFSLGFGAILGGIFAIVAGAAFAADFLLNK